MGGFSVRAAWRAVQPYARLLFEDVCRSPFYFEYYNHIIYIRRTDNIHASLNILYNKAEVIYKLIISLILIEYIRYQLHRPKRKMRQNAVMICIFYNYVSNSLLDVPLLFSSLKYWKLHYKYPHKY